MSLTAVPPEQLVPADKPQPVRSLAANRWVVLACRLAAIAVVLGLWQHFAGGPSAVLPTDAISKPSSIFIAFWHLVANGLIFQATWYTALSVIIGLPVSAVLGGILAALTARPKGRWVFQPLVSLGYAVPKVGLIQLFILYFGLHRKVELAIIVSSVSFIYYFALRQAWEELNPDVYAALRLMRAGRLKILITFVLPSAVPQLFAATRIGLPLALATEIFAEIVVGQDSSLGHLVSLYTLTSNSGGAMAVLLFVSLLGYLIDIGLDAGLRRYGDSVGLGGNQ